MTALSTIAAVVLMPLTLYIYASGYASAGLKIPYGNITTTLAVMLVFRALHKDSVLSAVLKYAGYTYGPLLGLFALGMFTRVQLRDGWVPVACVAAPVAALVIEQNSARWFGGYKMGFEALLLNGLCTVLLVLIGWKRSGQDGVAG